MTSENASEDGGAKLYVIATPIGNLEDITLRALRILGEVDVLACEDTRMTRRIFERHAVNGPDKIVAYHEHNEERAGRHLLQFLQDGQTVGLCSDGGFPGISDPGYRLVSACAAADIPVEVIPGASAVPTALLASGLSTASFTFKGFPPRKSGQRQRFFESERDLPHTLVVYESPHRVGKMLADALVALGDRQAAVCLELTKKFEAVHRGYLADLASAFENRKVRGEITVVIAGNNPKFARDRAETDEDSQHLSQ